MKERKNRAKKIRGVKKLGANAILAVSLAVAKQSKREEGSLYKVCKALHLISLVVRENGAIITAGCSTAMESLKSCEEPRHLADALSEDSISSRSHKRDSDA
ncbi:hypothetical protein Scep_025792 [Stephania cephalantha]|uniref:Uncharacterized protein n=1 Tax=Stephania cephalantha TaxID=152367 RepID=A0AAP0EPH4_9MAGN